VSRDDEELRRETESDCLNLRGRETLGLVESTDERGSDCCGVENKEIRLEAPLREGRGVVFIVSA